MLKRTATIILSLMMICTQISPVFAQAASENPAAGSASDPVIVQDSAGGSADVEASGSGDKASSSSEEDKAAAGESNEEDAAPETYALSVTPEEAEPLLYCLLSGKEWDKDRFGEVAFSEWIDPKNKEFAEKWKTADDLYKAYLDATDKGLSKDKKAEAFDRLMEDLSALLDEKNAIKPEKDKKAFEELLPGLYLLAADGYEPQFVVVSQEDVEAELTEVTEEKPEEAKASEEEKVPEKSAEPAKDEEVKPEEKGEEQESNDEETAEPAGNDKAESEPVSPRKAPSLRSGGDSVIQSLSAQVIGGAEARTVDGQDVMVHDVYTYYFGSSGVENTTNAYVYKVNFNLKDDEAFAPGSVSFTVPGHLIPDRTPDNSSTYGQDPFLDVCTLPVPEAPQQSANGFSYTYDAETDTYTITNAVELSATFSGVFEISYGIDTTRQNCWGFIVDGIIEENGQEIVNPAATTLPFDVALTVNGETDTTSGGRVLINTSTSQPGFSLSTNTTYGTWPEAWGDAPTDADDYVYTVNYGYIALQYCLEPADITLSLKDLEGDAEVIACKWKAGPVARDESVQSGDTLVTRSLENYRPSSNTTQYFYFLVRHPKDTLSETEDMSLNGNYAISVTGIDDEIEKTRTTEATAFKYILPNKPVEPSSGDALSWEAVEYVDTSGNGGLELLKNDEYHLSLKSDGSQRVRALALTLEDGGDPHSINSYGKKAYQVDYIRDRFYLRKGSEYYRLNPGEYEITEINLQSANYYDYGLGSDGNYQYISNNDYGSLPDIDVYVKFGNDDEWVKIGYYYYYYDGSSWRTYFRWDNAYSSYGVNGITKSNYIYPPEGVTAIKGVYSTTVPRSAISLQTSYDLYSSEGIREFIEDRETVDVVSVNTMILRDSEGTIQNAYPRNDTSVQGIRDAEENDLTEYGTKVSHAQGATRLYETKYSIGIGTNQSNVTNNVVAARAELTQTITTREYLSRYPSGDITLDDLYQDHAYRDQPSGTFYLLLPPGAQIEPASIRVKGEKRTSKSTEGSYVNETNIETSYTNNYKNSGRTLVAIHCSNATENPNGGFSLSYTLYYPWNSVADYGRDLKLLWAYQTDNDIYGSPQNSATSSTEWGHPDDADYSAYTAADKALMTDLDGDGNPEGTKPQFTYGKLTKTITVVTAASLNIDKSVKSNRSSVYTHGVDTPEYVYSGEKYSYQVHFGADEGSTISNAVIFDKLETYMPEDETESWQGTLDNIDLSQPISKGADAKVYYSAKEDIDVTTETDLSDTSVWSLDRPANPVAVAIDLRTKEDGTPFEIEENETINVVINMIAPYNDAERLAENGIKAYNDLWFQNDLTTGTGASASNLQHQKYTAIGLKCQKTNVDGSKVWLDETSEERPESVTLNLLKNGTVIDSQEVSADTKWAYSFKDNLVYDNNGQAFEYTVEEANVPSGYGVKIKNNNEIGLLVHFSPSMSTASPESRIQVEYSSSMRTSSTALTTLAGKTLYIPSSSFYIRASLYGYDKFVIDDITAVKKGNYSTDYNPSYSSGYGALVSVSASKLFQGTELPEIEGERALGTTSAVVKYESTGLKSYNVNNYYLTTSRTVTKHWTDEEESTRPESVTIHLLQNGEVFRTHELTSENGWTYTFNDLPMYDSDLNTYTYSASEEPVEGYKSLTANGTDITFAHSFGTSDSSSYVRIYYKKNGKTYYLREQGSSDGKWYGGRDSRYSLSGKTIHVPSDEIYIYFYNNNNTDAQYGFRVADISPAEIDLNAIRSTQTSLPSATTTEITDGVTAETAHPYNKSGLWHYSGDTHNINVVNAYHLRSIDGVVTWVNDNEANRPSSVTVKLLRNGEEIDSVTTDAEHDWAYSFGTVPRYDDNENDYEYCVTSGTDGYTAFYSRENDIAPRPTKDFFNVDMVFSAREITVTKNFVNVEDSSYYPETVTVHLVRKPEKQGIIALILSEIFGISRDRRDSVDYRYVEQNEYVSVPEKWVKDASTWTYTFSIPDNGDDWEVWEESIEGFRISNDESNPVDVIDNAATITNIYNAKTTVSGKKTWAGAAQRNIPSSITLDIYNDEGENVATVTTDEEHDWAYSIDLPKYKDDTVTQYRYKVSERTVNNFKAEYTHRKATKITFGPHFDTEESSDYVRIYYRNPSDEQVYRLNGQGSYDGYWYGSDVFSLAGKTIVVPSDDFYIYWHTDGSIVKYGFDIVSIESIDDASSATGTAATLPSYTVTEVTAPTTIRTAHNYSNSENRLWHYSWPETSETPSYGLYDVTNTCKVLDVAGTVTWLNDNEANRPQSVTVKLLRNGTEVDSREVTADDDWEYSFLDLSRWDASDNPYIYTVEETAIDKYGTAYTNGTESSGAPAEGYYDIENTFRTRTITVTKTWVSAEGENAEERPNVTIHLRRSPEKQGIIQMILGQIFGRKTDEEADYHYDDSNDYVSDPTKWIKNGDTWTYKFAIPLNEDNWEVWEEPAAYYTISNGSDNPAAVVDNAAAISNEYIPQVIISGTKEWVGDTAEDRPEKITLELLQDGDNVIDTIEVPCTETEWAFPKHEKYKSNGTEHEYKVRETATTGYLTTYSQADAYRDSVGTKITFGQFATYNSYDYLQIYYKRDGQAYLFKYNGYSSFYGSSSAATSLNNKTITIPSNEVYFKWYTNTSNTGYGFKINKIEAVDAEIPASETTATLPTQTPIERSGENYPETAHNYSNSANTLWKYTTEPNPVLKDDAIVGSSTPAVGLTAITNTANWRTFEGQKTWQDEGENDRPASITVDLLQNGEKVAETTTDAAHNWAYSFDAAKTYPRYDEHGDEYVYSVEEEPVTGYIAKYTGIGERPSVGTKITFGQFATYNSYDYLQIYYKRDGQTYQFKNNGYSNFYGSTSAASSLNNKTITIPSNEVYFRWYSNNSGTGYGFKINSIEAVDAEIPASETTATLPSLTPIEKSGTNYPETSHNYSNNQNMMWRYATTPTPIQTETLLDEPVDENFNITNVRNFRTFEGQKTWKNDTPEDRPQSVTIDLLRDGEVIDTTTTTADDNWAYSFDTPRKYIDQKPDGTSYVYSVQEHPVEDYLTSYSNSTRGTKITIGNYLKNASTSAYYGLKIFYKKDGTFYALTGQDLNSYGYLNNSSNNVKLYAGTELLVPSEDVYIEWWDSTSYGSTYAGYYGIEIADISPAIVDESAITSNYYAMSSSSESDFLRNELTDGASVQFYYSNNQSANRRWHYKSVTAAEPTADGFDITNYRNLIDISGRKYWNVDSEAEESAIPDSVTLELYQNGEKIDEQTVTADDDWVYSFEDVPQYDENMERYEYSVREQPVAGFRQYTKGMEDYGVNVTFGKMDVPGESIIIYYMRDNIWYRYQNHNFGGSPGSAYNLEGQTIYIPASRFYIAQQDYNPGTWEITRVEPAALTIPETEYPGMLNEYFAFGDLSPAYYSLDADAPYPSRGINRLTAKPSEPSIGEHIGWSDSSEWTYNDNLLLGRREYDVVNDYDIVNPAGNIRFFGKGTVPETIDVELLRNGTVVDTRTASSSDGFAFDFGNRPKRDDDGIPYTYEVRQNDTVDGYVTKYGTFEGDWLAEEHTEEDAYETVADYVTVQWDSYYSNPTPGAYYIVNRSNKQDLSGQKFWEGDTPEDRPDSIKVRLYSTNETITEEAWQVQNRFYDFGSAWAEVMDFLRNIFGGNGAEDGLGVTLVAEKTVTADDDWRYTFEDVPVMNDAGEYLNYRVEEVPFAGNYEPIYTTSFEYPVTENLSETMEIRTAASTHIGNLNITNVYRTKDISGVKEWEGGTPPDSVTLELYQDGIKVAETEATKANGWKYSFGEYPINAKDGHEYAYRISEEAVEGFIPEYSEYNATKLHLGSYSTFGNVISIAFKYKDSWYFEDIDVRSSSNPDPTIIVPSTEFYLLAGQTTKVPVTEPVILDGQCKRAVEQARISGQSEYTVITDKEDLTANIVKGSSGTEHSAMSPYAFILREVGIDLIGETTVVVLGKNLEEGSTVISSFELTQELKDFWIALLTEQNGGEPPEEEPDWDEYKSDFNRFAIYYNLHPGKIKNISLDAKTSVSGKKEWLEDDETKRPASITINLYRDGEKVDSQAVSEETKWRYKFDELPRFDAEGNEYTYTVMEDVVKGYKDTYANHDGLRVQLSSDLDLSEIGNDVILMVKRDGIWYDYDPGASGLTSEVIVPGNEIALQIQSELSEEEAAELYGEGIDNLISIDRVDEIEFPYEITSGSEGLFWTDRNGQTRGLAGGSTSYEPAEHTTEPANATYLTSTNDGVIYYIADGNAYMLDSTYGGVVPSTEIYIEKQFYTSSNYNNAVTYNDPAIAAVRGRAESFSAAECIGTAEDFLNQTESDTFGSSEPIVWNSSTNTSMRDAYSEYLSSIGDSWSNHRNEYVNVRARVAISETGTTYVEDISETGSGSIKTSDAIKTPALAVKFGTGNSSVVRETVHDDFMDEDINVYAGHVGITYEGGNGHAYMWYADYSDWVDMLNGKTLYIPSGKFWITFYDEFGNALDEADPILDIESIEACEMPYYDCIPAADTGMTPEQFFDALKFDATIQELPVGTPVHPKSGAEVKDVSVVWSATSASSIEITDMETLYLLDDAIYAGDFGDYSDYRAYLDGEKLTYGIILEDGNVYKIAIMAGDTEVGYLMSDTDAETGNTRYYICFYEGQTGKSVEVAAADEEGNKASLYRYNAIYQTEHELPIATSGSMATKYGFTVLRYKALSNANSITNTYMEGEFKLQKKGVLNTLLPGTEFGLYFADRDWTQLEDEPTATAVIGEDGRLTFSGVPYGNYLLYETKVVDGYKSVADPWKVTITDTGAAEVEGSSKLVPIEGTTKLYDNTNGIELKFGPDTDIDGSELHFFCVIDGMVYEYVHDFEGPLAGKTASVPSKEVYIMVVGRNAANSEHAYGFDTESVTPKQVTFNEDELEFIGTKASFLELVEEYEEAGYVALHECSGYPESLHYMPLEAEENMYHYKYTYDEEGEYLEKPQYVDRPGLRVKFAEQEGDDEEIAIVYVYKDRLYGVSHKDEDGEVNPVFTASELSGKEFCLPAEKVYILGIGGGNDVEIESITDIEMQAEEVEANLAICIPLGKYDSTVMIDASTPGISATDNDIVYNTACETLRRYAADYANEVHFPMTAALTGGETSLSFDQYEMYTYDQDNASSADNITVEPMEGYELTFGNGNEFSNVVIGDVEYRDVITIMSEDENGNVYYGLTYDEATGEYSCSYGNDVNGRTLVLPGNKVYVFFGTGLDSSYCYSVINIDSVEKTQLSAREVRKIKAAEKAIEEEEGRTVLSSFYSLQNYTSATESLTGEAQTLHPGQTLSNGGILKYVYSEEDFSHGLKVTFGDESFFADNEEGYVSLYIYYERDGKVYMYPEIFRSYEALANKTLCISGTGIILYYQRNSGGAWESDTEAIDLASITEADFTEEEMAEVRNILASEWDIWTAKQYALDVLSIAEYPDMHGGYMKCAEISGNAQMLHPGDQMPESYWDNPGYANVAYAYNLPLLEESVPATGINITLGDNSNISESFLVMAKVNGKYTELLSLDSYMLNNMESYGINSFSIPGASAVYFIYDGNTYDLGDNVLDIVSVERGSVIANMLTGEIISELLQNEYNAVYSGNSSSADNEDYLKYIARTCGETLLTGSAQQLDPVADSQEGNEVAHVWGTELTRKSFIPHFIEQLLNPDRPTYEIANELTSTEIKNVNTSDEYISGNVLQILDENDTVVDSWTTGSEVHAVSGLTEGKTYKIHQVSVVSPYLSAEDMEFTIQKGELTEVKFINDRAKAIVIKENVRGTYGLGTDSFSFSLTVESASPNTTYTIKTKGDDITFTTDANGAGTATFTLKSSEEVTIEGMAEGASVSITQAESDYFAGYKVDNDNQGQNDEINKSITAQVQMAREDIEIQFTNSRDLPSPTGVREAGRLAIILFIALMVVLLLIIRSKQPKRTKQGI